MMAGAGALFLEKMQDAARELRLQAARGERSTRGGSRLHRAGALATDVHDHSPRHNLCRLIIVYLRVRGGRPGRCNLFLCD